jgi:PAS domain S-box-containing protein
MSLRRKTLFIVGITIAGLIGVLYATTATILRNNLIEAEQENSRQTVKGVLNLLTQTQEDFNTRFADWGAWDDTYNFIENRNQAYIESNLVPEALANLNINLALFVNVEGKVVFGTGLDLKKVENTPLPEPLRARISPKDPLFNHPDTESSLAGFLLLPEGPMLVASRPILTSKGTGPIRGTVVFGRYLNEERLASLSRITRLPLTIQRIDIGKLPPDFQAAKTVLIPTKNSPHSLPIALSTTQKNSPIFVAPLDQQTIAGYTLIKDIYDQPAFLLRVDIPRDMYWQGQQSLNLLVISLFVVGLGFGSCTLLLLERLVLSRLANLSHQVSEIGNSTNLSLRLSITGTDELSRLAGTINAMLAALESAQNKRRETEERYQAIIEQSSEGIFIFDAHSQKILEANPAFEKLLGYTSKQILQLTIFDIVTHDRQSIRDNLEKILAQKHHSIGERHYLRKDGSWIDVEVSASLIILGGRQVVCAVVRDITERKRAEKALQQSQERLRKQNQVLVELAKSRGIFEGNLLSYCRLVTEKAATILGVERVGVWIYSEDRTTLYCLDCYQSTPQQHTTEPDLTAEDYPIYFKALEQERTLTVEDVYTDSRVQELYSAYMRPNGVTSLLDAPIRIKGQIVGIVCHEHIGRPRSWTLEEQNFAGSLADLVALSLQARDRQRAEEALRQAEEKYRMIFENAIEGIFQTTPEGQYLSANRALARIYGYHSPEELMENIINVNQQLYVDFSRREEFIALINTDGSVANFESQIYRKEGDVIWISENGRAVRDSDGNLLYYEGTVEDITQRKTMEEALRYQQEQSERLLLNILPAPIAHRLKQAEGTIAESFPEVTVLFADIVGFTQLSANISPTELVNLLNKIFSAFDLLAQIHDLEKIKTIGDAYMVVGGLPTPRKNHAQAIAEMALDMKEEIARFNQETGYALSMRIGINTGPVVAGVIGLKKFIYDLWGDTVNVASRMESHGLAGCIQVTHATYEHLQDRYSFEERGMIEIKGKGEMLAYLLTGKKVSEKGVNYL